MAEDDPTTAASTRAEHADVLAQIMREVDLAQHGQDFDHVMPNPVDAPGWVIVLKDGTNDHARIGCIRP